MIWSYILEFENIQNPYHERQHAIQTWKALAVVDIEESPVLLDTARSLVAQGVKAKDALHVACAVEGQADYFLSTDDKLLKKIQTINIISALNPMDYIKELPDETTH